MPTFEQFVQQLGAIATEVGRADSLMIGVILYLIVVCIILATTLAIVTRRRIAATRSLPGKGNVDSGWRQSTEVETPAPTPAAAPVVSAKRIYRQVERIASGDLCDVHYALAQDGPYLLKASCVSGCNSLLTKERLMLRALHEQSAGQLYGEYFPVPAESFQVGPGMVSAFEWRDGFCSAEEILRQHPRGLDGQHLAWMMNRTLEALGFVHRLGWVHGAVLPPHLLFHPRSHGLQLVGWVHAERVGSPIRFVSRKHKAWYPPECRRRQAASPATDIYLAAKSMVWLAGGDPLSDGMPKRLPVEVQALLRECLLDSPIQRPQDAWALHERFKEVLRVVYGPPKFCHFNMY